MLYHQIRIEYLKFPASLNSSNNWPTPKQLTTHAKGSMLDAIFSLPEDMRRKEGGISVLLLSCHYGEESSFTTRLLFILAFSGEFPAWSLPVVTLLGIQFDSVERSWTLIPTLWPLRQCDFDDVSG